MDRNPVREGMIVSSIDIGTNTVLMATVQILSDGTTRVLGDEHAIARLGKGVDAHRRIDDDAVERVATVLRRYRGVATSLGAERIVCFGTSALRDASNREDFIEQIRARTGCEVTVLSGDEEARYTFSGALFGLDDFIDASAPCAVLDIGGGSTELAVGTRAGGVVQSMSIDIGAVRLTERFFAAAPPAPTELSLARHWTESLVASMFDLPSSATLIGVAGTVTTLGALASGHDRFDENLLNGYRLTSEAIAQWVGRLSAMRLDDIRALKGVHPERADILLGGAIILDAAIARLRVDSIMVSTRGVRYGMALATDRG